MIDSTLTVESDPADVAALPVFQAGARIFSVADILTATGRRGEFALFRENREQRLTRARRAAAAGLNPAAEAIDAAVAEFRYARDLVSAEECDRWLAQRGLVFADLTASVTRRLQAELPELPDAECSATLPAGGPPALRSVPQASAPASSGGVSPPVPIAGAGTPRNSQPGTPAEHAGGPPALLPPDTDALPPPDLEAILRAEALLADEFTDWARQLAWRIALAAAANAVPAAGTALAQAWPELEERFTAAAAALAEPQRRLRELAAQRLQLLRVEVVGVEFPDEAAAREACLCVREDAVPLAEVAAANNFPTRITAAFLAEFPAEWQPALLSATVGDVLPSRPGAESAVVLQLLSRREPSLDDADVAARLDAEVRRQHFSELENRHIRWLLNVEVEA